MELRRNRYRLGILGGMGPEATAVLFSKLVKKEHVETDQEHIECVVLNKTSIPDRTKALLNDGSNPLPKLNEGIEELINIGCDYFIMPCNTAHAYKNKFKNLDKIKFIDMVSVATDYIDNYYKNTKEVVTLFCTNGTRMADVYKSEHLVYPSEQKQEKIMDIITSIKAGNNELERLKKLIKSENKPIIFACTELSIYFDELYKYFKENPEVNVYLFDAMDILIDKVIELCK